MASSQLILGQVDGNVVRVHKEESPELKGFGSNLFIRAKYTSPAVPAVLKRTHEDIIQQIYKTEND